MKAVVVSPTQWELRSEAFEFTPAEMLEFISEYVNNCEYTDRGCMICHKQHENTAGARRVSNAKLGTSLKLTGIHRLMFMLFHGFIMPDPECRHLCNEPKCINPYHLWPGDRKDNFLDRKYEFAPKVHIENPNSVAALYEDEWGTDLSWDEMISWAQENNLQDELSLITSSIP